MVVITHVVLQYIEFGVYILLNRSLLCIQYISIVMLVAMGFLIGKKPTYYMAEWLRAWDTLARAREFDPRPGHYSRMSF